MVLASSEWARQRGFDGNANSEQEQLLEQMAGDVFDGIFIHGTIRSTQMVQLGLTWKGVTNYLGWQGVASTLEPGLRARVAYVMAHRYIRLNNRDQAALFLEQAATDLPKDSPLAELATEDHRLLKAGHGKVSLRSELDEAVTLSLSRPNEEGHQLEVNGSAELELPAGTFRITTDKGKEILVFPSDLVVTPAGRFKVRITQSSANAAQ